MSGIAATIDGGRIVPTSAIPWPEGSKLWIEPETMKDEKLGLDESEWDDSPEGIARRSAWLMTLKPPPTTIEEDLADHDWQKMCREFQREAVRKQWKDDDQP